MTYLCHSLYLCLFFSPSLCTLRLSILVAEKLARRRRQKESHHHQPHQPHHPHQRHQQPHQPHHPKMTPLYPLLAPLLLLTHQSLAAPNDQHQQHQQKPPHVTKRAVQAARRNSAKITFPPLPLSLSSSTSAPPPSCPTTLTVENRPGCGGCTTTEYATTLTQSVDCGDGGDGERCESLVTSTLYHRAFGICPVRFFFLFYFPSVSFSFLFFGIGIGS